MMSLWSYEINDFVVILNRLMMCKCMQLAIVFCFVFIGCLENFVYVLDV
jgi:hypothetical protein